MIIKHDPKEQLVHQLRNIYAIGISSSQLTAIDDAYPIVLKNWTTAFLT